jgi:hypothetical protein
MTYVYYINGEKFITSDDEEIPWEEISSPNENTPVGFYSYHASSFETLIEYFLNHN